MLEAESYQPVYLMIVTGLSIIVCTRSMVNKRKNGISLFLLFFIYIFFVLFIGFRPISEFFVDMPHYQALYDREAGSDFSFNWQKYNLIYDNLESLFIYFSVPPRTWYSLMSFIYFTGILIASYKFFPNDRVIGFLVYLAGFSTFAYATNGIKAGVAASVFLMALAFHEKKFFSFFLAILSYGFHHAMILPVSAYLIVSIIKRDGVFLLIWIISFFIAVAHITFFQSLFANFTDEHGAEYLIVNLNNISGFRLDFVIYGMVPIFVRYLVPDVLSDEYRLLWRLYTLANSIWMLCMYASYNNRIAYLSWFLYPIVLIYPFIKSERPLIMHRIFYVVVFAHLSFSLFMYYVYYA